MKIEVLICTFRRPFLEQTLASVAGQVVPDGVSMAVIVADNDTTDSARGLVNRIAAGYPFPLTYIHAPERNISVARNACLDVATADWVAFLDDDETATPGWIADLWQAVQATGADAVFAPARAMYPAGTADWITGPDYHSNIPERRDGVVMTGHTCNAILRWAGTPWQGQRFDLARGRSGGEDTAFFFALRRMGARFEATDAAEVYEPVVPGRLSFGWLARRKFRMGQSYASSEPNRLGQLKLALTALVKAGFCGGMALVFVALPTRRNFWALRGCLHCGVVAGCLALPEPQAYGH
jgi:succinoglycan biosynthesis protein ExoM